MLELDERRRLFGGKVGRTVCLAGLFMYVAAQTNKTGKQTKPMQDNVINDLPEFMEGAQRGLLRMA